MLGVIQNSRQQPILIADDVELADANPKLVKVLKKLLQPNLKLHNDDYLNLLLTHLTKPENTTQERCVIKQLLLEWLKEAVAQFEKRKDVSNPNILNFVLNITRYVCESEHSFFQLNSEDIFERLVNIVRRASQPNVTVSLIKLLADFMEHKSGIQWIISTNHWELLINSILKNETIYVSKEGYKFVADLLEKSVSFNQTFCKHLIQYIIEPLDEAEKVMPNNMMTDPACNKRLISTLNLLSEVLMILLLKSEQSNQNTVIQLFINNYNLEKRIKALIKLTNDKEVKVNLYKTTVFLCLYDLKSKFAGLQVIPMSVADSSLTPMGILFGEASTSLSVAEFLQMNHFLISNYYNIKAAMPKCINRNQQVMSFEDQSIAVQIVPIYSVFVKVIGIPGFIEKEDSWNDFRYKYETDLMTKLDPKVINLSYKWFQHLIDNFHINNGILGLTFLTHTIKYYEKENGALAFQTLYYLMDDMLCYIKKLPHVHIELSKYPDYLALHLKVMQTFIEQFELTWKDSVEALSVINLVYNLLNEIVWPTKVVVNALKLAEKGISKYMSFQMALLIDDTQNSVMNGFAPMLNVKLHDGSWEVRDSTVEIIHQLAITANNAKFSSYKKLMLENDFPSAIVRMATTDGNSFVRASALKCLQEMIKVQEFWENITTICNIFETILKILQTETEGIVRAEVPTLVDCIYEYQQIPEELMTSFYDAMSHAVVADLHWEVRVNALKFWKRVIDDCLTQQGMIDGCFPSVTFSKQLKKIVTLSPHEIQKRLVVVLQELSQNGCLSVFYEAIQDECDLEVSKTAIKTISHFVSFLKEYKVSIECMQALTPAGTPTIGRSDIEYPDDTERTLEYLNDIPRCELFSETVMDQILDSRDLNLLESFYNAMDTPVMENIEIKKRKILSPEDFLNLAHSDLESRLSDRTNIVRGIDNFESLLDDILKEYEPTDVNSMDCY